MTANFMKFLW